ncbi:MAG: ABC transporter permease subunit [Microthrixaceae bacterium]|nr:ABC transporter permease subunit [Microthrixaceae bacterium]
MLLHNVAAKTLRDRTPMAGYAAGGLAAISLLGMWIYSGMGSSVSDLTDSMPEALSAVMGLGAGDNYLVGELFGLIGPIAVLVVAISGGVAAVAGEERDRTAGLLLAQPVTRRQVVWSKAGVLLGHVAAVAVVLFVSSALGAELTNTDLSVGRALAGSVHLFVFGAAFAMFALALSAATGSATKSMSIVTGVAVATNLLGSLLPLIDSLDWVKYLSPWHYYDGSDPIVGGIDWADLAVLGTLAAIGMAAALVSVRPRDLESVDQSKRFRVPAMARLTKPRMNNVFAKELSDRSSIMIIATGYLAAAVVGMAALYPALEDVLADFEKELPSGFDGFVGSGIGSPAGWMNAEVMSILGPLVLIGLAAFVGSKGMSSVAQRNPLAMVLAAPVPRRSIVVATLGTMATVVLAVAAGLAIGMLIGSRLFGLDLGVGNILGAAAHLALLAIAFGAFAVMMAAATTSTTAVRVTAALGMVAYLANALLPQASWGETAVKLSPWYYYFGSDPLSNGPNLGHLSVLVVLAATASVAAVRFYERRDIAA